MVLPQVVKDRLYRNRLHLRTFASQRGLVVKRYDPARHDPLLFGPDGRAESMCEGFVTEEFMNQQLDFIRERKNRSLLRKLRKAGTHIPTDPSRVGLMPYLFNQTKPSERTEGSAFTRVQAWVVLGATPFRRTEGGDRLNSGKPGLAVYGLAVATDWSNDHLNYCLTNEDGKTRREFRGAEGLARLERMQPEFRIQATAEDAQDPQFVPAAASGHGNELVVVPQKELSIVCADGALKLQVGSLLTAYALNEVQASNAANILVHLGLQYDERTRSMKNERMRRMLERFGFEDVTTYISDPEESKRRRYHNKNLWYEYNNFEEGGVDRCHPAQFMILTAFETELPGGQDWNFLLLYQDDEDPALTSLLSLYYKPDLRTPSLYSEIPAVACTNTLERPEVERLNERLKRQYREANELDSDDEIPEEDLKQLPLFKPRSRRVATLINMSRRAGIPIVFNDDGRILLDKRGPRCKGMEPGVGRNFKPFQLRSLRPQAWSYTDEQPMAGPSRRRARAAPRRRQRGGNIISGPRPAARRAPSRRRVPRVPDGDRRQTRSATKPRRSSRRKT